MSSKKTFFSKIWEAIRSFFGGRPVPEVKPPVVKPVPVPDPQPVPPVIVDPKPTPVPEPVPAPTPEPTPVEVPPVKVPDPEPIHEVPVIFLPIPEPVPEPLPPVAEVPPVSRKLIHLPSKLGMAITVDGLKNPKYATAVIDSAIVVGAENAFKPDKIGNVRGQITNNADAEKIAKFARDNGKDLHFHCPNWAKTSQTQKYVKELAKDPTLTREDWKGILKEAVQTMALYAVKLGAKTMDSVNEAFNESEDIDKLGIYRDCIWFQKLGKEFVPLTFQYIHEVAPDIKQFLTDYGQEFGGKKAQHFFALANEMVKNKVPIHGLGYQTHVRIGNSRSSIKAGLQKGVDTGLLIAITEFDMAVRKDQPKGFKMNDALKAKQAQRVLETFQDFNDMPENQKAFFMTWGVDDGSSWLKAEGDFPLLFDASLNPKPAVEALMTLVK